MNPNASGSRPFSSVPGTEVDTFVYHDRQGSKQGLKSTLCPGFLSGTCQLPFEDPVGSDLLAVSSPTLDVNVVSLELPESEKWGVLLWTVCSSRRSTTGIVERDNLSREMCVSV